MDQQPMPGHAEAPNDPAEAAAKKIGGEAYEEPDPGASAALDQLEQQRLAQQAPAVDPALADQQRQTEIAAGMASANMGPRHAGPPVDTASFQEAQGPDQKPGRHAGANADLPPSLRAVPNQAAEQQMPAPDQPAGPETQSQRDAA